MNPRVAPRTSCLLQGAVWTAAAVKGIVPVVHSSAGCLYQQYLSTCLANGSQNPGHFAGLNIPSTNVIEKHVIFGGTSRLREQLKNTVKVLEGDLYFVVSGCAPDLVGDDSQAMTEEIKEQGYPATYLQASGFLGSAYLGYQLAVKKIINFIAEKKKPSSKKIKGLVNIFGIVPGQDSTWQGDLMQLESSFKAVGLKANVLFGLGQTLQNWQIIPQAELNISLSPWGFEVVKYLEEKFSTPYINEISLPVGVKQTTEVIGKIAEEIELDSQSVKKTYKEANTAFDYFLEQFAEAYFNFNFQQEPAIIGPTNQVLGISRFLADELGFNSKVLIATDNPPIQPTADSKLIFTEDLQEITSFLRRKKPSLILGSVLEKKIADELQAIHLSASFPLSDRILINKGYAGFSGGLNLIEDLGTSLIKQVIKQEQKSNEEEFCPKVQLQQL